MGEWAPDLPFSIGSVKRTAVYVVLALVVAASLLYGSHQSTEATEARGAAEAADARAERWQGTWRNQRRAAAELDSMLAGVSRQLEAERAENEARGDSIRELTREEEVAVAAAGDSVDATVDSLEATVPGPLFPVVRTLDAQIVEERRGHESVKELLRAQNVNLQEVVVQADSATALCRRSRLSCLDRATAAERALEEVTAARDHWRDAANPGFLAGFARAVPQVLTGAGLAAGVVLLLR